MDDSEISLEDIPVIKLVEYQKMDDGKTEQVELALNSMDLRKLWSVSHNRGWSQIETLRRAIATISWLDRQDHAGVEFLARDAAGNTFKVNLERN